jgi:hypothetical protein
LPRRRGWEHLWEEEEIKWQQRMESETDDIFHLQFNEQ